MQQSQPASNMTEPTDNEIDALVAAYLGDCGPQATRVYSFARAVLAKWGTLRAEKIVIPTDTMEQEFQKHYRRGYEAGKKATTAQPTQAADSVLEDAERWQTFIALPYATRAEWASNLSLAPVLTQWVDAARKQGANHD
ncbi:hypothetical protein [EBPR siphovirus 1]|nr:hypothetical protein [EBPR siphovirus 1]